WVYRYSDKPILTDVGIPPVCVQGSRNLGMQERRAWNKLSGRALPALPKTHNFLVVKGFKGGVSSVALKSGLFMPTVTGRMQGIAEMAASHVPYDSLSDAEVMLRAGTDDAAYEYLVTKYHRPMIAFMYRMCRSQAVAEELAQEVFLRVYRSRKSYAAEAKFTTWLYR